MVSGQNCNRACPEMLHRPSFCINTFGPKMLAQIPSCCTDETISGVVSSKTLNVRLLSPGLSSLRSDRAAKDSRHKPYRPRSEPDHHSLKHNPGGMINMSAVAAAAAAATCPTQNASREKLYYIYSAALLLCCGRVSVPLEYSLQRVESIYTQQQHF